MFTKKLLLFITAIAISSLACGFTIDMPIGTDIKTGPTVTEEILVPDPDPQAETVEVALSFGAGEISVAPGAEALIAGTATYNVEDLRPEVETTAGRVELSTGNLEIDGFPNFHDRVENTWALKLGNRPMALKILAGAYSADFELGGLPLTDLRFADGAADVRVNFAESNPKMLTFFQYETGASNVILTNLGNANFQMLDFSGGAGNYELDFSGDFQNDAAATIEVGLSSLTLTIPDDLNVRVNIDSGLSNISTYGAWGQSGGAYTHNGEGATLQITVKMGAGSLILRTE